MSYKFLKSAKCVDLWFPQKQHLHRVLTWQIADTRCVHSADVAVKVQVKVVHIQDPSGSIKIKYENI